jgi:GNAT superfamily N-acetyltransferase
MHDVTIRDRDPADLPRCLAVLAEVHHRDRYPLNWPADPHRWLSPPQAVHAWIAETDLGTVIGHVAVHHVDAPPEPAYTGTVEISRLFVAPAARRHHVATTLLHHARQWATTHRLNLVLEIVEDRRSTAAMALYERTGWQHTDTTTATWTDPEGRPVRLRRYILTDNHPSRSR